MRPTISLAVIAKNEAHNIPEFFQSIEGCFDKVEFTDTGSTDNTVELAKEWAFKIGVPISIHDFKWVNDFSAARNFAFSQVKTDYAMWLDLDDVLPNSKQFIQWRDTALQFADMWLATYDYASAADGTPIVSFMRERVVKMSLGLKWQYFVHEGIVPSPGTKISPAPWRVKHRRSLDDLKRDKGRNLSFFEGRFSELNGRMWFYYGKELFENQRTAEALKVLKDTLVRQDLEFHDRILAFQYACYSGISEAEKAKAENNENKVLEILAQTVALALAGIQIDPARAELWTIVGDCFLKQNRVKEAKPFFAAASNCLATHATDRNQGALFTYREHYESYPLIQMAKISFNIGEFEKAYSEAKLCFDKFKTEDARLMLAELEKIKPLVDLSVPREKVEDIVFTTPPQNTYPFDEELYKTKGMGGSETALILMAKYLKKLTGRNVLVFNQRDKDLECESGVHYISNTKLNEYMMRFEPKVHIAWRHNIKLTNAKTFVWCHDLMLPGAETIENYEKILALTPFHRDFLMSMQGLPENKIHVTRNGIPTEKFNIEKKPKNPNKLVWLSSPDRGLDRAIKVVEQTRRFYPELELHVYYGLDNLYKYGLSEKADMLKKMMDERPWVHYHGFTEQSKMIHEVSDAVVWVHPCDFVETSCITANECLANGIYPLTRRLGGLQDTLKEAEANGLAVMLDHDCITQDEYDKYSCELILILHEKRWERLKDFKIDNLDWINVAKEWVEFLQL